MADKSVTCWRGVSYRDIIWVKGHGPLACLLADWATGPTADFTVRMMNDWPAPRRDLASELSSRSAASKSSNGRHAARLPIRVAIRTSTDGSLVGVRLSSLTDSVRPSYSVGVHERCLWGPYICIHAASPRRSTSRLRRYFARMISLCVAGNQSINRSLVHSSTRLVSAMNVSANTIVSFRHVFGSVNVQRRVMVQSCTNAWCCSTSVKYTVEVFELETFTLRSSEGRSN